ncbi:uncharacterized protein [Dysidea avara]|uniref:uncharacterized protein isoform X2 n=1 Tax=Dysidea avara TaxID=196820 RepID=UPI00331AD2EE
MSSLTYKLFDKILEQNESIKVDELLKYFTDRESTEYQQVADASQNPVGRTEKLKTLVLKSYRDKKLKDLQFFKYLAWSGQSNLCKMIGYNDKQIAKWMREKPTHSDNKPSLQTAGNDTMQDMETDQGLSGVTAASILKIPSSNADMSSVQATPKVFIVYCKEDGDNVWQLSDFLRDSGINCDIDQYHSSENITDWGHWSENMIKKCCSSNGFILLICSNLMYQHLCVSETATIKMSCGYISSLSLRSTYTDEKSTPHVIPVFLEECQTEYLPPCLKARSSYSVLISRWIEARDTNRILNTPGLDQLQSLVRRLTGQPEVEKSPLS